MVENDALSRLREAAEIALYRAIAHEKSHRLSYKAWARARDLGIALPEADPWLNTWTTNIADTSNRYQGAPVRSGSMTIMSGHEPDIENALSRALARSEEHTSELQSLMRISYAVFCLKTKTKHNNR